MKVLNSSLALVFFAVGCACDHPVDVVVPGTAGAKAKQEVADQQVGPGSPLIDQKIPGPPAVGGDPAYQLDGPSVAQTNPADGTDAVTTPALVMPKKGEGQQRTGAATITDSRNKISTSVKRRRSGAPESGSWTTDSEKNARGGPASKAARTANALSAT